MSINIEKNYVNEGTFLVTSNLLNVQQIEMEEQILDVGWLGKIQLKELDSPGLYSNFDVSDCSRIIQKSK